MRIIAERREQPFQIQEQTLHVRGRIRRLFDKPEQQDLAMAWNVLTVSTPSGKQGKLTSLIPTEQAMSIWDKILSTDFNTKRPIKTASGREARGQEGEIYDIPGFPYLVVKKYLAHGPFEGLEPHLRTNYAVSYIYDNFYQHKDTNPIIIPRYLGTLEIPGGDSFTLMEKLPEGFFPLITYKAYADSGNKQSQFAVEIFEQSIKFLEQTVSKHYPLWNRLWKGGPLSAETRKNLLARTNPETKQVELAIVDL